MLRTGGHGIRGGCRDPTSCRGDARIARGPQSHNVDLGTPVVGLRPTGDAEIAPTCVASGTLQVDAMSLPNRRSIRLRDYDYTQQGAYFITICTMQRLCLFGEIVDGEVQLSPVGYVADARWQDLPNHTPRLTLDAWVVMPNHLHGVLILPGTAAPAPATADHPGPAAGSLGRIIGGFKSAVSREVAARDAPSSPPCGNETTTSTSSATTASSTPFADTSTTTLPAGPTTRTTRKCTRPRGVCRGDARIAHRPQADRRCSANRCGPPDHGRCGHRR